MSDNYRNDLRDAIHLLDEACPLLVAHIRCGGQNPNQLVQRIIDFIADFPFIDCDETTPDRGNERG